MNPATALAIGLGLVGAYLFKTYVMDSSSSSVAFINQGGALFWPKELAPKLVAALTPLKATPHSSVERVWILGPTGTEPALAKVKAIQASGSVVSSSPNLLEPNSWPKAIAQVTPAELMTYADKSAAILPAL
jgi:hypothetical protein